MELHVRRCATGEESQPELILSDIGPQMLYNIIAECCREAGWCVFNLACYCVTKISYLFRTKAGIYSYLYTYRFDSCIS